MKMGEWASIAHKLTNEPAQEIYVSPRGDAGAKAKTSMCMCALSPGHTICCSYTHKVYASMKA